MRRLTVEARKLPNQAESVFNPTGNAEDFIRRVPVAESTKSVSDLDYLTASSAAGANGQHERCLSAWRAEQHATTLMGACRS